jgi:hypothetical protein
VLVVYWKLIAISVSIGRSTTPIQHEQYLFVTNNTDVEYLTFLSQQGKMVSSEPSNLRKK